ncbi:MAG: class I SAM-dependent methyltransferase [Candidatus Marinimicrobia bacterium]|nr:class I SAM-dependent methyltransferase [Candidatus Neomarinimicrobiota bacterium]|tara:strand:+ start:334 stop:1059 length:726 start_codon:yes stop_codon:yes gene_type:complete
MGFAVGKPAELDDFIITRRIDIVRAHNGFFDETKSLLDVGCGNGGSLFKMHPHFKSCHGIDIVEGNISTLQNSIISKQIKNCTADIHDIDNAIVNKSYYQRAISFEVLEHVKDEKLTLSNIYKSLNHEALFAISVPNKWWFFETHGAHLPFLPWNRVPFFSWLPKKIHSRFAKARIYTKSDICKLVQEQGFNILSVDYITAPMDVIKWMWLKSLLRKTIFRRDTTKCPILSTAIMVICNKI